MVVEKEERGENPQSIELEATLPGRPAPSLGLRPPHPGSVDIGSDETLDACAASPFHDHLFAAWTVERYAAFTADRRLGDVDVVRAEYGIADGAHENALVVYMNRRLAASPSSFQAWSSLVSERLAKK
ncbi:MAG: hypothetical protein HOW73_42120 [Polyangiaceae bacterium]|nr:hypothetical protein [Polyangiaceae bacterium]